MSSLHIAKLFIYPIKSCYGIELHSAQVRPEGLDLDRRWCLVNSDNKFLTIREIAKMTLIRPRLSEDESELLVEIPDEKGTLVLAVRVPTRPTREHLDSSTTLQTMTIWKDSPEAWIYDASVTEKLSEFLGQPVRLACKAPGASDRELPGPSSSTALGRETSVGFADFLPVLVASLKSLEDLNQRLADAKTAEERSPVTIRRFRPNIVIDGDALEAWSEDSWKCISFSTKEGRALTLDLTEICLRCLVPNVDPESGVKNKHEPWDTAMSYRRIVPSKRYKPAFGMLAVPRPSAVSAEKNAVIGTLQVGACLTVEESVESDQGEVPMEETPVQNEGLLGSITSRVSSWLS
ncbi:hypothetical protein BCR37DRAFT_377137 [Protomyces lactucae-debilis]|uniref:MOSC domain-containing protein n=1 Tax=Protomyces lactucae-debilis TaxID=2754530 RepID=A0A1Y2FQI4_PROLT|nr:uncharacterized protein BCR37DRAFT_377137 [Protomyces lactucae-debilis]ORY85466.1 hypothetical protein BCR37DRAFT_377137 [Protomyces lactucae-debilis]